ncbi:hypothetical protein ACOSP7_022421 [Xanthoceras sorbifolium]
MSNSGSEQRDHQRDHGTAIGDRDESGGTSPRGGTCRLKSSESPHLLGSYIVCMLYSLLNIFYRTNYKVHLELYLSFWNPKVLEKCGHV